MSKTVELISTTNVVFAMLSSFFPILKLDILQSCRFCCDIGDAYKNYGTIRYDTVDLHALKSWWDGQLNLAHGPEKIKNQKPSSSEETVQAKGGPWCRMLTSKRRTDKNGVEVCQSCQLKLGYIVLWQH